MGGIEGHPLELAVLPPGPGFEGMALFLISVMSAEKYSAVSLSLHPRSPLPPDHLRKVQ